MCLVSGGMDSAVTLAEAHAAGFAPFALSFQYGQRFLCELEAAARVARVGRAVEHRIVRVDLDVLGGSVLTDPEFPGGVPKDRDSETIGAGVPSTYVPARNTVFLSIALAWAEVLGARDLFLGVNAVDYSGYPDCRPAFLEAFEALARVATAAGTEEAARFRVHAPLIDLSKAEIVLRAEELGVDLALTHSCYDPVELPETPAFGDPLSEEPGWIACGRCDACRLRLQGFKQAGRPDPIRYAESPSR